MEEFNLSKINIYSIDELAEYILNGSTTKEQLYKNGLFRPNRPLLDKALESRDDNDWALSSNEASIASIEAYLDLYNREKPFYVGRHVEEATELLQRLINETSFVDEPLSEPEKPNPDKEDNSIEISSIIASLANHANLEELAKTDNGSWLNATAKNTIHSYEEYLRVYRNNPWGYIGKHIDEAKRKILQIQERSDWNQATITNTRVAYQSYVAKYESARHLLSSHHIEEAKLLPVKPKPLPILKWTKKILVFLCLCFFAYLCVWAYKTFTKSTEPHYLTQEETSQLIQQKQDSLTIEIFDGFYLVPAKKGQGQDVDFISPETNETIGNTDKGPTTKDEVIADYLNSLNGKYNVVNTNGDILSLPDAGNGIDSLCLKNAPFIEYLDNNGLRRVVALLKDDVYYYLGECGSHDGFRQYILANKKGKSGLVDVNGTILKDFFNEKITLAANGYYVKNGSTNQFYNFAGNAIDIENNTVSSSSSKSNAIIVNRNNGNQKDYFKDNNGRIIASFDDIGYSYENGYYKVKGANGKYGIYNTNSRSLTVPTIYDDVSIYGYKTNLFPAKKDGKWGYVRAGGAIAIPFKFNEAFSFGVESQLAAVKDEHGKCGYIDMSGNFKIPAQYYSGGTMSSEGARVMKSSTEYGYITKSGSLLASWYPYMGTKFVLDRIFVRNNDKLGGFVNKQNQLVIPYIFDSKSEPMFDENSHLAKILYNGIQWYINTNGAFCYPASSDLKPSDQNIPEQISIAKERAETEARERENKNAKRNDRKSKF